MEIDKDLKNVKHQQFKCFEELDNFLSFTCNANINFKSKESNEWWTITTYVHNKVKNNDLNLSLIINKGAPSKKPDFFVNCAAGNFCVETTDCSEKWYEYAISNKKEPINTKFMDSELVEKKCKTKNGIDDLCFRDDGSFMSGPITYKNKNINYAIKQLSLTIENKIRLYKNCSAHCTALTNCPHDCRLVVVVNLPLQFGHYFGDPSDRERIHSTLSANKGWGSIFNSIHILWTKDIIAELDI